MKIACKVVVVAMLLTGCATVDTVRIDADGTATLNGKQIPTSSLSESFTKDEVIIRVSPSTKQTRILGA